MPGPFPGMDPYMENRWGEAHIRLMVYTRSQLRERLPHDLTARVEENPFWEDEHRHERDDPIIERWIYIFPGKEPDRIVTIIEYLCPWHKTGARNRQRFRDRQEQRLNDGVNLVEIDLTRRGVWSLSIPSAKVAQNARAAYSACAVRARDPSRQEYWPKQLQERLPVISVPLRDSDNDVTLDLQALIDQVWKDGGYDETDYSRERMPPLSVADEEWVRERVRQFRPG